MHEWPALGPLDRGHVALVLPPALGMQNGPGHAHCHCNGLRLILQRSWTCPHATSPEFRARGGSAWVQEQARQHASQAGLTGRHGPGRRPAAGPGRRPVEVNASAWAAECQGRAGSSGEVARPASFVEAQTSQPRGLKKKLWDRAWKLNAAAESRRFWFAIRGSYKNRPRIFPPTVGG